MKLKIAFLALLAFAVAATIASFTVAQTDLLWPPGIPVGTMAIGKPGAANDSARQHMAAALPDLAGEPDEPRALEPSHEEGGETHSAEVVMSRPPAEVVQLDRFRKK